MDDMTKEQRSQNMSRIRSVNTKPEDIVGKFLFAHGFRYRKHDKRYAGKPDFVLPKYKTVVFVNGCFWHSHADCKYAAVPKTNMDYWLPKLLRNAARDQTNYSNLQDSGWRVIIVWECALRRNSRDESLVALANMIYSETSGIQEITSKHGLSCK